MHTVFLIMAVFGTVTKGWADTGDDERLYQHLFKDYNPLIRPVVNISDTIVVQFNLALSQIINVDEKNQIMKTNVWLQVYWDDYQLKWDPKDYGGIEALRIRPEKAWTPDIVLFNNADGNYEVSYRSNVIVYKDGAVNWIPPAIYKSSCTIDVQYFPFDEQICDMKFGSWTFKEDQLNFTFYMNMNSLDVTDYLKSGTWDILDSPAKIERVPHPVTGDYKTMVIFTFKLRRKTLFYTVNLIIPCVLISFVTICVFALPADAGEKITLCISILLALVVFLLLISKILPPSLTIPLVAKYLLFTFIMNIAAISLTVIVINRNYRTPRTYQMPYWVRLVFLNYLPRLLFMERPGHSTRWRPPEDHRVGHSEDTPQRTPRGVNSRSPDVTQYLPHSCGGQYENLVESVELPELRNHSPCRLTVSPVRELHPRVTSYEDEAIAQLSPEILKAAEALRFISRHLKNEDEYNTVLDDWKYVARVIDRLLLYIFLCVTVLGTVCILMQAPHILEYVDQDQIIQDIISKWVLKPRDP
ncbi:acetylcholine receptor subunit beta-like 1 isoform X2 [Dreissena polymorpha]|uniref:acetylcholine receptor subunit beta-like 1 isoform X2 n=1 Tax=Dreissena polymorpha TaxID=45954 RepID=UPI0022648808|nr:acetylcholine receptor subunit beta-like 1 isoform X2 [Dreissena polymorpha]